MLIQTSMLKILHFRQEPWLSDTIELLVPFDKAGDSHLDWCTWLIPNSITQIVDISFGVWDIPGLHWALVSNSIETKTFMKISVKRGP